MLPKFIFSDNSQTKSIILVIAGCHDSYSRIMKKMMSPMFTQIVPTISIALC